MPLSIEDELEIMGLLARYNHAIDGRDAEAWADTFTEDGLFEGSRDTVKGRAKLLIGVARGRKSVDKRHAIKERDVKRDVARELRNVNR